MKQICVATLLDHGLTYAASALRRARLDLHELQHEVASYLYRALQ